MNDGVFNQPELMVWPSSAPSDVAIRNQYCTASPSGSVTGVADRVGVVVVMVDPCAGLLSAWPGDTTVSLMTTST